MWPATTPFYGFSVVLAAASVGQRDIRLLRDFDFYRTVHWYRRTDNSSTTVVVWTMKRLRLDSRADYRADELC